MAECSDSGPSLNLVDDPVVEPAALQALGNSPSAVRRPWSAARCQPSPENTWPCVRLEETGAAALIAGNHWHDGYWGVCRCGACREPGANVLGVLLMWVREARR